MTRATVYRRFPDRIRLLVAAIGAGLDAPPPPPPEPGDIEQMLAVWAHHLARPRLRQLTRRLMTSLHDYRPGRRPPLVRRGLPGRHRDRPSRLYSARPGHTTVGASVTEPGWLDSVPRDRLAIVVADGLLNFLPEHDVRRILSQIVERFPSGEICFNITSPVVRKQREKRPIPLFTKFGIAEQWFPDDPRHVEGFHRRLRLAETGSPGDASHRCARPARPRRHAGHR
ncbi:hypothetical protein [Microbispora sp. NPDC046933]|uniref:hypothetical protein n=1 Tax=Microbispora sp. NPDC046933 TaxID=3155618 RepID=UPI0033C5B4DD